jgi:indole-3-glycerol phosphate synthase / phosphoribosylanthranilate isomerase
MANVLEKIVADKRNEMVAKEAELPLASFIDDLTPSSKSFYNALAQDNAGYILECKKASPSKGLIRPTFDLDEILDAYLEVASCLSVLTDEKYFQGTYEYLAYVTARVDIPVLNKDFFVNEYQVYLARYYQADAVLLMLSVLDDETYTRLHKVADSLSLDVLTEISNAEEAERAVRLGAKIIGINNRNLRDLSTDLAATEQLVPLLQSLGHEGLMISESGIYTRADITRLAPHVDGFLVGSALMAQADLRRACRELVYGPVKVCGVTSITQAQMLDAHPTSYLGLIFAEKSPRYVNLTTAEAITEAVSANFVGVFVNADVATVVEYAKRCSLAAVQLHGDEDQEYIDALRQALPATCAIWLALGISESIPKYDYRQVDLLLCDCQSGSAKGGTGQIFDWDLLATINTDTPIGLAGGLEPDNITEALAQNVALLDVNSGVERTPGEKCEARVTQLFANLRRY